MARSRPVVAIDGPAGAGKSTASRMLAVRLGFVLVDTGALYRGVALAAREQGIDWGDGAALGRLTAGLAIAFAASDNGPPRLVVDGKDRSAEIRTPEISMGASHVSKHPEVRAALLDLQRQLGVDGGVVLEGRDIGTVVFPDAEVKIFLTASAETRARRRLEELAAKGTVVDYEATLRDIQARDRQDSERPVAPLKPAVDSIVVDTSDINLAQVVDKLVSIVKTRV